MDNPKPQPPQSKPGSKSAKLWADFLIDQSIDDIGGGIFKTNVDARKDYGLEERGTEQYLSTLVSRKPKRIVADRVLKAKWSTMRGGRGRGRGHGGRGRGEAFGGGRGRGGGGIGGGRDGAVGSGHNGAGGVGRGNPFGVGRGNPFGVGPGRGNPFGGGRAGAIGCGRGSITSGSGLIDIDLCKLAPKPSPSLLRNCEITVDIGNLARIYNTNPNPKGTAKVLNTKVIPIKMEEGTIERMDTDKD